MPFDAELLRRLEYLTLVVKKSMTGSLPGTTVGPGRGGAQEFRDHRRYAPGDELRYVDWNIYGRSERLYVKEFCREESLHLILLLDKSASMTTGGGEKFALATILSGALGFVGLVHLDAVSVFPFASELEAGMEALRGKGNAKSLLNFLEAMEPGGRTAFASISRLPQRSPGMTDVAFVISDFLAPGGYSAGLVELQASRVRVNAIHIVSPKDLDIPETLDARVEDHESKESWHGTIDKSLARRFRTHVQEHRELLKRFCLSHGMGYTRAEVRKKPEHIVFDAMRTAGLLAR